MKNKIHKVDPLTQQGFWTTKKNQRFACPENQTKYNNLKANKRRKNGNPGRRDTTQAKAYSSAFTGEFKKQEIKVPPFILKPSGSELEIKDFAMIILLVAVIGIFIGAHFYSK